MNYWNGKTKSSATGNGVSMTCLNGISQFGFCCSRFVDSLPDKGEKVNNFRTQIKVELDNRQLYDTLCKDMLLLDVGKGQLDTLEWTGKQRVPDVKRECSQSDIEDDGDVLKMFATHSGIHKDKIFIKYTKPVC